MSSEDPSYKLALEQADISWTPATGLVKGPQTNLAEIAKQNNLIIELLVSLHKRVTRIESSLGKTREDNLEKTIVDLTTQVANLKLESTSSQPVVRKEPGNIAVWIDPREQIKAFKEQLAKKKGP